MKKTTKKVLATIAGLFTLWLCTHGAWMLGDYIYSDLHWFFEWFFGVMLLLVACIFIYIIIVVLKSFYDLGADIFKD